MLALLAEESDPRVRFVYVVGGLIAESLAVEFTVTMRSCEEVAGRYLGPVVGAGDERERAAVARFTEELAGVVGGGDEVMAEEVYELCGMAASAYLWPDGASEVTASDGLVGWVA